MTGRREHRRGRLTRWERLGLVLVALVLGALSSACAAVPQNRRARFADPMMSVSNEPLDAARRQKLYDSREGAAGGDGVPAGGGCGCQ